MSKAYDRVEWSFVSKILLKMGFALEWVSTIMDCVSSVSYFVVVNGEVGECFTPTRGLRQGDPLSPYLFLICNKGLSFLLRSAESCVGSKVVRRAPKISHLFFADDSLIFGEAMSSGACILQALLGNYSDCSGQLINFKKSGIFFIACVLNDNKADVRRILGITSGFQPKKYLGLSVLIEQNKRKVFADLRDKTIERIVNSGSRTLSQGGKEVFIKVVLQAIPIYAMCCFLLPKTFRKDLEALIGWFWWQNSKEKKGIHWCS
ncbi:hypothetical protein HRI_002710100 [Hibiscus trionum]|uniref:Reverse transcriptase domain-containing protein n=1 Tax=Hibiscus trionum TaxID=183268 RepID=A0A9W7M709_HIBTR|nr:hypothetical protein HRI_002710100 [Hibiscus trionum]